MHNSDWVGAFPCLPCDSICNYNFCQTYVTISFFTSTLSLSPKLMLRRMCFDVQIRLCVLCNTTFTHSKLIDSFMQLFDVMLLGPCFPIGRLRMFQQYRFDILKEHWHLCQAPFFKHLKHAKCGRVISRSSISQKTLLLVL